MSDSNDFYRSSKSMQFVARRLAGERMAKLCREFGISGKTGYKIFIQDEVLDLEWKPIGIAIGTPTSVRETLNAAFLIAIERLTRRFSGIPIPAKTALSL